MSTLQEVKTAIADLNAQDKTRLTAELFAEQASEPDPAQLADSLEHGLRDVEAGRVRPLEEALRRKATHTSEPPAAPGNLRLKTTGITGELLVLILAVARARMYEVEYTLDPVNGPWTQVPAFESSRGMKLTGLTRGKDYYVRVRAVATGQNRGPWSDVASALAM